MTGQLGSGQKAGLALLLGVVLFAALGPALIQADPARQDLSNILARPSADWLLGTDHLGRSVLARLAHAARLSLLLGTLSVAVAAAVGIGLGLLAAWRGGATETALTSVADAVLALPGLLLVVLVSAIQPGAVWPLFLGLSVAMWVEWFRMTRATAASRLASPAVEAARLLGLGTGHVLLRHVFPSLAPIWGALAAFGVAQAVLTIGGLGFIGVGLRPPQAEWGLMMAESFSHYATFPSALIAPAACLCVLVLALQLVAGRRAA